MAMIITHSEADKARMMDAAEKGFPHPIKKDTPLIEGGLRVSVMEDRSGDHMMIFQVNQNTEGKSSGVTGIGFTELGATLKDYYSYNLQTAHWTSIRDGYEKGTHPSYMYYGGLLDPIETAIETITEMEALKTVLQDCVDHFETELPKIREWFTSQTNGRLKPIGHYSHSRKWPRSSMPSDMNMPFDMRLLL